MTRRAQLDTSGRSDAADLERLARDVLSGTPAGPAPGVPDGYQYLVTVDGDRSVAFADPGLSEAQRELVERVLGEDS
jgi:hypothetical protein